MPIQSHSTFISYLNAHSTLTYRWKIYSAMASKACFLCGLTTPNERPSVKGLLVLIRTDESPPKRDHGLRIVVY
jgi:hypothetical protein